VDPDLIDEDASLRQSPRSALTRCASCRRSPRNRSPTEFAVSRALVARPELSDLATLLVLADTDEVVRLRLLRAPRDLGV
jgi:hypothetical protein